MVTLGRGRVQEGKEEDLWKKVPKIIVIKLDLTLLIEVYFLLLSNMHIHKRPEVMAS